jgi:ATP-dependent RNA helicase RhlE
MVAITPSTETAASSLGEPAVASTVETSFEKLGLAPHVCEAVQALGWVHPTPVQAQTLGPVLHGCDVLVTAQTGSGKTLAYALPLLQTLLHPLTEVGAKASAKKSAQQVLPGKQNARVLVLVPTRELAIQVGAVFKSVLSQLSASHPSAALKLSVVYGGVSINPQMMALRGGADVVVATPGRLLDLVDHNALKLHAVQHLVLDEADRLLDLGFADELHKVLALCPKQRQTLLFSATFADDVQTLAQTLLHQPVRVAVETAQEHPSVIHQRAIAVDEQKRTPLLRQLIQHHKWERVLVFVATRYACEHVANKLYQAGVFATALHGEMSQGARQEVLEEFKESRWEVLVTTDLAARGIDIAQLPVVVNYDLPRSATDYTHRIGRTGRAGVAGEAVSFVTPASAAHWRLIQKRQHLQLTLEEVAGFEPLEKVQALSTEAQDETQDEMQVERRSQKVSRDPNDNGGVKGKRPSKKDKLRAAALLADSKHSGGANS